MADERKFLAAIRAAPKDAAVRLAYADWLEEQGDPCAELVRVEEEMRRLAVYSDRFWKLKPRRNELRSGAAPEWLGAMGYGTVCQPAFGHGWPDGWRERWRLIREFTERWYGMPVGDVGGRKKEVRAIERRLGRSLPPSLREWVAFAYDAGERYEDDSIFLLRHVYEVRDLGNLSAVSLLVQGEGHYGWAVRHADLHLPDPPVYGFLEDDENVWFDRYASPFADSVTGFAIDYAVAYCSGEGGRFNADVTDEGQVSRDLQRHFPVRSGFGNVETFEDDDILVGVRRREDARSLIFVEVARPLPRKAIPAFLWDLARSTVLVRGMFDPDRPRQRSKKT
jgi:uncharacterized protein (TIGR02996 family)